MRSIDDTISTEAARRFYDWLGAGHDSAEFYESRAKRYGIARLELAPDQHVLNVGIGTGKDQASIQNTIAPNGNAFGLDLSRVMLRLVHTRSTALLCEGDARYLPFASASFDRLLATYILDLLPLRNLPGLLANFRRVLKPSGRIALVSLTEGVTWPSRALVALWKVAYAVSPVACGGCRPLQLYDLACEAGFSDIQREVIVQLGVPSEVITANC